MDLISGALVLTNKSFQLSLSELIDLEVAFESDRTATVDQVRERDKNFIAKNLWIFQQKDAANTTNRLCKAWLESQIPSPSHGERFISFLSLLDLILVICGLILGGSTALILLHYDGTTPINILQYLGVFVLLQLLLLLLLAIQMFLGFRLGVFQEALRNFAYIRTKLIERVEGGLALIQRVRKIYTKPETWLILKVTQHFAVAFQISALIVSLSLIGFTDLAFGWSTTLNISPETFFKTVNVFSMPWAWLGNEWQLSIEQIRDSQFFRLENSYVSATTAGRGDVAAATSWWRFLVAAHVTYGLLPRLAVWVFSSIMLKRSLKKTSLDSIAFSAISRRLLAADPAASSQNSHTSRFTTSNINSEKMRPIGKVGGANLIVWRDLPAEDSHISTYLGDLGIGVNATYKVGGQSPDVDGSIVLTQLDPAARSWVILVEDWESPGKAFKNLIDRLKRYDNSRPIYVVLVKVENGNLNRADDSRVDLWRRHIHGLSEMDVWLHI